MIAIKEFRYWDFAKARSVEVQPGEALDPAVLARNKVDVDKLSRTKFLDRGEGASDPTPRKKKVRAR